MERICRKLLETFYRLVVNTKYNIALSHASAIGFAFVPDESNGRLAVFFDESNTKLAVVNHNTIGSAKRLENNGAMAWVDNHFAVIEKLCTKS